MGRGSVANYGERIVALVTDLAVASLIGLLLVRPHRLVDERRWNLLSVAVFVVVTALVLSLSGRTPGMRLMGLQVVRLDGRTMGWRSLPRQLLVALLIPAVIVDRDRRGLHDRAVATVVVRVR